MVLETPIRKVVRNSPDRSCCTARRSLSASPVTEVAVTNTIAVPEARRFDRLKVLSIASLLAQAIRFTHSDQSVSSLFD